MTSFAATMQFDTIRGRIEIRRIHGDALALISGVAIPLAFAPFRLYAIAPLTLGVLFGLWRSQSPRCAARRGFAFGIGWFSAGHYWLFETLNNAASVPAHIAGITVTAFVLYLSAFPAACGYLANSMSSKNDIVRFTLVYPALFTLFEWLRGEWPIDFPWLQVGYSAIDSPIGSLGAIGGVHFVGWLVASIAGLLCLGVSGGPKRCAAASLCIGAIALGGVLLDRDWTRPSGDPVSVLVIQGNIAQKTKWHPSVREPTLQRYRSMTLREPGFDVVVWPETAVPAYRSQLEESYLHALRLELESTGTDLVLGIPDQDPQTGASLNTALALSAEGGAYHKRRLVPFGEYVPVRPLFAPILKFFGYHKNDYGRGELPPILTLKGEKVGVSICYEALYGEVIRDALPESTWLLTLTNDAWFGNTTAPHQHFQMARMRAIETGRTLVRAANSGFSGAVGPRGQVLAKSSLFDTTTIDVTVVPREGTTPYVMYGDKPLLITLAIIICIAAVARFGSFSDEVSHEWSAPRA